MRPNKHNWQCLLPKPTASILCKLQNAGYIAYLVGGAVRDLLLKRTPKDFDLVTNATPEQVQNLFPHTLAIGAKFGIIIVIEEGIETEVATFRKDNNYTDHRHPESVEFSTPQEDAKRRDFTINGLFWNNNDNKLYDYINGIEDINQKTIRTIGTADDRFSEDALRILRAIRFYTQLSSYSFQIEKNTLKAIHSNKSLLKNISKERITQELSKILTSNNPSLGLNLLHEKEIFTEIAPSIQKLDTDFFQRVSKKIDTVTSVNSSCKINLEDLRWTTFLFLTQATIRYFILPNRIGKLLAYFCSNSIENIRQLSLAEQKRILANENLFYFLSYLTTLKKVELVNFCLEKHKEYTDNNSLAPKPLLSGKDLIALGIKPGPDFSSILNSLYDSQLNDIIETKQEAIIRAKELLASLKK